MIVRTWHGCVPLEHAEGFAKHLAKTGVEHSRSIQGAYRGTWGRSCVVRLRTAGSISFWQLTGRIYGQ